MLRLGFHLSRSKNKSFPEVVAEQGALMLGADVQQPCCQIFLASRLGGEITLTEEELETMANSPYDIFIHAPYNIVPWSSAKDHVDELANRQLHYEKLATELTNAVKVRALGVVVHLNDRWMSGFDALLLWLESRWQENWPRLYLENHAVAPRKNGVVRECLLNTPERVNRLIRQYLKIRHLNNLTKIKIGVCLDTAHLWGNGTSFTTESETDKWLSQLYSFDYMFHLNDSKALLGSGQDLHGLLGHGHIWRGQPPLQSGVHSILRLAKANMWPVILECDSAYFEPEFQFLRPIISAI